MRQANIHTNKNNEVNPNLIDQNETLNIPEKIWHDIKNDPNAQHHTQMPFTVPPNLAPPSGILNNCQELFPGSTKYPYYPINPQSPLHNHKKDILNGKPNFL